jgi:hypothetical protein
VLALETGLERRGVFVESVLGTWIKVGRGCRVRLKKQRRRHSNHQVQSTLHAPTLPVGSPLRNA